LIKKGIILAGGTGSRLQPSTLATNKQLLMLYDKPVIFYPLSILMLSNIKDILIIVNKGQINNFKKILGDGSNYGIKINYQEQLKPTGIPEAFVIGEKFISNQNVALILGDNFFYGQSLGNILQEASKTFKRGANIFIKAVKNPENYGVAQVQNKKVSKIVEKPKKFISNKAITGLYFFDNRVINFAKNLKPSRRKETEITDLIKIYQKNKLLKVTNLGLGSIWSDTGTVEDMHEVSNYIASIDRIQSFKIACLEEIALDKKWTTKKKLRKKILKSISKNDYFRYIEKKLTSK
jgi:glucose-1-phosphate thymidylyltransferase